ncbi:MAG: hypothetical protein ACRC46_01725 [Thermoguttaceae bacterium]
MQHKFDSTQVTPENFRDVLPKRWLEYLHALGNVEGTTTWRYTRNGRKNGGATRTLVCNYPFYAEVSSSIGKAAADAMATNSTYWFRLERNCPNNPADVWAVERQFAVPKSQSLESWAFPRHFYMDHGNAGDHSGEGDPIGYHIFNSLGVGLFADGSVPNLPDVVASEQFKVNEVAFLENDGKRQFFLDFSYVHKDYPQHYKETPSYAYASHFESDLFSLHAKVWLETDYFLVTRSEYHTACGWGDEHHVVVECVYDCDTYSVPLPKKYNKVSRYRLQEGNTTGVLETDEEFDLRETNPKDETRFTLSAFGLPEPKSGEAFTPICCWHPCKM